MMAHWSVIDEPASLATPEPACAKPVAAERGPVERIAEILDALFVKEPELVAELLGELNRADTQTLVALFGPPVQSPAELLTAGEPAPAEPGPGRTWSFPAEEPLSRWDDGFGDRGALVERQEAAENPSALFTTNVRCRPSVM